ncbi:hypothetical protein EV363DRAFT_1220200, partial [Boletus edulis]
MPLNRSFIHVACFAVGALVGGGVASVVSSHKPTPVARPPPIIDLDRKGDAKLSTTVPAVSGMVTQMGVHVPSAKESSVETESACDRLTGRVVQDQSRIYSCARRIPLVLYWDSKGLYIEKQTSQV